jgi:hypothetical protein
LVTRKYTLQNRPSKRLFNMWQLIAVDPDAEDDYFDLQPAELIGRNE